MIRRVIVTLCNNRAALWNWDTAEKSTTNDYSRNNAPGQDCLFCEARPAKDASGSADCLFLEKTDEQTAFYIFAFFR